MIKRKFTFAFLALNMTSTSIRAIAQEDVPSPTGAPERDSSAPTTVGTEEDQTEEKAKKSQVKNVIAGTGLIFIVPSADVGYLSTTPNPNNIFSKLETPASGWLVEPKVGFGVFSQKLALDILAGVQLSSLAGKRTGKVNSFESESPTADFDKLDPEQPYTLSGTNTLIEGNARVRFSSGTMQAGVATTTVFSGNNKIYSSVSNIGLPYVVFAGPQFLYEQRVKENLFRVGTSVQFSLTGNQRSALAFKVGGSYSFLLNSPFLTVTEKKVTKSKTTIQKKIVTTREQNIIQNENVSFIFDSQTINFKFNKAELSERSQAFVAGLGQIFSAQRSDWQKLTIEGHTDSKGNPEYNKRLSLQRATTVKRVLVENGLSDGDITAVGYGKERLMINPERTEIDFAKNRRVEIKVQGLKDARILQRSITRLQEQIFPKKSGSPKSEDENKEESQ